VLLHLVDDLPRISDGDHFRRWLYRASFQVALDARKMRRRRMDRELKARAVAAAPEATIERVHEHVAALDDDLRALVAEHYFERKPLEALAEARGCSTTAVWKRLERAKEKLRESITRAGFAAAVPHLEGLLTSHKPVSAPKGLLSQSLLAKVATAAAPVAVAVKLKALAVVSTAVLLVTGAVAYGVLQQRHERRVQEVPVARRPAVPKAAATAPAAPAKPGAPPRAMPLDAVAFMLAFQNFRKERNGRKPSGPSAARSSSPSMPIPSRRSAWSRRCRRRNGSRRWK
jgi:hypothetical protein